MTITRRHFIATGALATLDAMIGPMATGQDLPAKPIRVIVPFVAGSSIDARMRIMAQGLSERLRQQVIVENKPGAGGSLGAAQVAQSPGDGATLLFTNNSYAINPHVYKNVGYDPMKSLTPVCRGYVTALVVLVDPRLKVTTLKEFVALAKAKPEVLNYGSSGIGSLPHFAAELFLQLAGVKLLHIPFKGDAQVMTEILGGRVSMVFSGVATAQPHVKSGAARALAVTTPQRNSGLAEVPTMAEAGFPDYKDSIWTGYFAPAATPRKTVEALNREITAMLNMPSVRERMEITGAEAAPMNTTDFATFIRGEVSRYAKLVKDVGLTQE